MILGFRSKRLRLLRLFKDKSGSIPLTICYCLSIQEKNITRIMDSLRIKYKDKKFIETVEKKKVK